MNSTDTISFLNGLVCGGSISLLLISLFIIRITTPVEGIMGITTFEIRFAIFASITAIAITIAYEIYRKRRSDKNQIQGEFKNDSSLKG